MRRVTYALTAAVLLWGGLGLAQPVDPDEDGAAIEEEAVDEEEATPEAPPKPLKGDVIHLKNGKILSDVQVSRETPSTIEVQVHPDLEPLILPRRQIDRIDYDKRDPNRPGFGIEEEEAPQPDVLVAQQVPESLRPLLTQPRFQDTGLNVTDRDFLILLNNQSRRAGINLEISDQVRAIPEEERLWTVEIQPDKNFLTLLESLLQAYPQLEVSFTNEKVILRTKAEAEADQNSDSPAQ